MAIDMKKMFGGFFEEVLAEVIGAFLLVTLGRQIVDEKGQGSSQPGGQRMPHAFGIGQDDEAIFGSLRQLMDDTKRPFVDLAMSVMEKHEKVLFRITLAKMSCGGESFDDQAKGPKGGSVTVKKHHSWEFTKQDLRVKYLNELADEIIKEGGNKQAALKVVAAMRARDLITRSWFAEKVHVTWSAACKWVADDAVIFFGVSSIDDITPQMVHRYITGHINLLARQVPYRRPTDVNLGFWRGNFRRHPIRTTGLALVITGAFGWFTYLVSISNN